MKKILCLAALLGLINYVYAQNTFPTPSGNVGIGTTTPGALLSILGTSPSNLRTLTLENTDTVKGAALPFIWVTMPKTLLILME